MYNVVIDAHRRYFEAKKTDREEARRLEVCLRSVAVSKKDGSFPAEG